MVMNLPPAMICDGKPTAFALFVITISGSPGLAISVHRHYLRRSALTDCKTRFEQTAVIDIRYADDRIDRG